MPLSSTACRCTGEAPRFSSGLAYQSDPSPFRPYKSHGRKKLRCAGVRSLRNLCPHFPPCPRMSAEGADEKRSPTATESIRDEKQQDHPIAPPQTHVDNAISNVNAKLANPLMGLSHEQLMDDGAEFARSHGLGHLEDLFRKGALAAQDPLAFDTISHFTEAEKDIFRREITHRWDHPGTLYYLVILCSVAAAVQGVSVVEIRLPFLAISSYLIRWTKPSSTARICSLLHNSASTPTRATRARTSGFSAWSTRHHMYALRSPLECVPIHCSLVCSCVAPSLVAGSPNLSIIGLAVGAPSSSALVFLSSPAFGKVSLTRGSISSSLAFSSE